MTHVIFYTNQHKVVGFKMQGHAMYNTKGPDILCSALSTAAYMTTNGICMFMDDGAEDINEVYDKLTATHEFVIKSSLAHCMAPQMFFNNFAFFIKEQVETYPKNVSFSTQEVEF